MSLDVDRTAVDLAETRHGARRKSAEPLHRLEFLGVSVLLLLPFILAGVDLIGRPWTPVGDDAAILYRVSRVGSSHTPLVGAYSTRGWAHPGPILYWLLAVPWRIMGGSPTAVLASALALNAVSLLVVVWLVWRRRRGTQFILLSGAIGVLLYGIRPDILVQPWNPYPPLLPYLGFLIACWGLCEKDIVLMPLALALASLIVQMHLGYAPLVVTGLACAAWALALSVRSEPDLWRSVRRTLPKSVVICLALWVPPLLDLVWGDHNLYHVARYFRSGSSAAIGFKTGLGLLSGHVGLDSPWIGRSETVVFLNVQPGSLWWIAGVAACLGLAALYRRRVKVSATLPVLALLQLAAAAVATARIERPVLSYLLIWMLPLACFCWMALLDTAYVGVSRNMGKMLQPPLVNAHAATAASLALLLVPVVASSRMALNSPLPQQAFAIPVRSLTSQLESAIGQNDVIRIEGSGEPLFQVWPGVVGGLARRGQRFYTSDGSAGQKWGVEHRWEGQQVDYVLTFAVSGATFDEDPVTACSATKDQQEIARWDALDADQRKRLHSLQLRNLEADSLSSQEVLELERLTSGSLQVAVFKGRAPCGLDG